MAANSDATKLLKPIRGIAFNFQSQKCKHHSSVCKAGHQQALLQQGKQVAKASARGIVTHCGGNIGARPGLASLVLDDLSAQRASTTQAEALAVAVAMAMAAQEWHQAMALIMSSSRGEPGDLLAKLESNFLKGNNECPKAAMVWRATRWPAGSRSHEAQRALVEEAERSGFH